MKKVEQLKAGMEVWMKFRVEENNDNIYVFKLESKGIPLSVTNDIRLFPNTERIEMFTIDENEIPELKGVEMEVSDDDKTWINRKVYGKSKNGYMTAFGFYNFARPISKTFDLTNVPEHLLTDELKQYLR